MIINKINDYGHLIGLHIDESFFSIDEKNILSTLFFFKKNGYKFSNAISFHKPTERVLNKKYKNLINTYEKRFFNKKIYISDSRKNIIFKKKIDGFLNKKNKTIQILLHPIWWSKIEKIKRIYIELKKNSVNYLNNYLLENFPKVFSKIIPKKKYLFKL